MCMLAHANAMLLKVELNLAMQFVRGSFKKFLQLDEIPEIEMGKYKAPWEQAGVPQAGEGKNAWVLEIPGPDNTITEKPLPQWMNLGVDTAITQWVSTHEKFDVEIQMRAAKGKTLTPKRQKAYDSWRADPVCRHSMSILCMCVPHAHINVCICVYVHMYVCMYG